MATVKEGTWNSPMASIHDASFCQLLSPFDSVPDIFDSSPITTSRAAPKRKPVITGLDRKFEIHPMRNTAITRKAIPAAIVIPATSAPISSPATPVTATAPAATAASAELGPVDICRDVPNRAYRMAPAAAA